MAEERERRTPTVEVEGHLPVQVLSENTRERNAENRTGVGTYGLRELRQTLREERRDVAHR